MPDRPITPDSDTQQRPPGADEVEQHRVSGASADVPWPEENCNLVWWEQYAALDAYTKRAEVERDAALGKLDAAETELRIIRSIGDDATLSLAKERDAALAREDRLLVRLKQSRRWMMTVDAFLNRLMSASALEPGAVEDARRYQEELVVLITNILKEMNRDRP